jgi:hypothetical protein
MLHGVRIAMILCVVVGAACGHGTAAAPDGPPVLTVSFQGLGVVASDPAGIACGTCSMAPTGTCPSDPNPYTDCSYEFAPGTSVKLTITKQQTYSSTLCSIAGQTLASCTIDFEHTESVTVIGAAAAR